MQEHIKEKVAILVPIYKEPMNVIERMLVACHRQNADNIGKGGNDGNGIDLKVWLCIDGADKDEEKAVSVLATKYGINLSTRPDRRGFRAGALNYCIQNNVGIDTKYIIVLDVDQAPKPNMVEVLVREMEKEENNETHFIMFPQVAENADKNAITKASDTLQRYDYYFNRRIRSLTNSAFVVGTNWICRADFIRKYPFEEGSIVEDQSSSVKWHSKGAVIKVINKELALGLAPDTVDSWRAQQARWSHGALYNLRYLVGYWKDLSFWQRIDYLSVMLWYMYAIPMVLSILIPLWTFTVVISDANPIVPITLLITNIIVSIYPMRYCKENIKMKELFETACVQHICIDLYLKSIVDNIRGKKFSYVVSDKTGRLIGDFHKKLMFSYMLVLVTGIGIIYALYIHPPTIERIINAFKGYPLNYATYIIYWLILGIFWTWGAIYIVNKIYWRHSVGTIISVKDKDKDKLNV